MCYSPLVSKVGQFVRTFLSHIGRERDNPVDDWNTLFATPCQNRRVTAGGMSGCEGSLLRSSLLRKRRGGQGRHYKTDMLKNHLQKHTKVFESKFINYASAAASRVLHNTNGVFAGSFPLLFLLTNLSVRLVKMCFMRYQLKPLSQGLPRRAVWKKNIQKSLHVLIKHL